MQFSEVHLAVINFAYFTANFRSLDFIEELWPGFMGEHFRNKIHSIQRSIKASHISVEVFMKFFFELSYDNQVLLVNWIEKNYHFSQFHK